MRQLPRNVRVGPPRFTPDQYEEPEDAPWDAGWDGALSGTPPPVAVVGDRSIGTLGRAGTQAAPARSVSVWVTMAAGLLVAAALVLVRSPVPQKAMALRAWVSSLPDIEPATLIQAGKDVPTEGLKHTRADLELRHDGYASLPGGVLYSPETLSSSDGAYDLLLHFHGNVKVVVESVVAARLNAAVAVINLGIGSAHYEDFYAVPGRYEQLLKQINQAMERRGLRSPRLRRVALSSWSAGYGAISTVLMRRRGEEPLDAILVLDGIHVGWNPERPSELNTRRLAPFEEATHAAASDAILFSITYSEIDPPTYAGSRITARYLLGVAQQHDRVERRTPEVPAYLRLEAMRGAVSKQDAKRLEPIEDVRVGGFHVKGFTGNTKGHHMAHLFQMGSTVLPELVQRWSAYSGFAGRTDAIRSGTPSLQPRRRSGS